MRSAMRGVVMSVCVVGLCGGAGAGGVGDFTGGVNVDFNIAVGAGAGQPTILHGGALGQGGYWTPVNGPLSSGVSVPLRDLGNSFNAAFLTMTWTGGDATRQVLGSANAATSGDDELLMDDYLNLGNVGAGVHSLGVSTFGPGLYRVCVYACAPDSSAYRTSVSFRSNQAVYGSAVVGGAIPAGGVYTEGVTHATGVVPLLVSGPVIVDLQASVSFGSVNGVQVQRLTPTRLYVREGGAGLRTGLSWADALPRVHDALTLAAAHPTVTEVWVGRGRYYVDPTLSGVRATTLNVRSNLAVRGGFVGSEATLAERGDPRAFAHWTIIDGSNNTYNDGSDDALACVTVGGANGVVLDGLFVLQGENGVRAIESGLTVENGYFSSVRAGAIDSSATVLTVRDSSFVNCNGNGTVLFTRGAGSASMDRCTAYGGNSLGFCAGVARVENPLTVTNSLFYGNRSGCGGQFEVFGGGSLTMQNCTLAGNTGDSSASNVGLLLQSGSNSIVNSILWGNRSPGSGLGLQAQQVVVEAGAALGISDSIVEGWDGTLAGAAFANNGLDPQFVDANGANNVAGDVDDNYRLASFSPARDSGWFNGLAAGARGSDVVRNARVFDDLLVANTGFDSASNPIDRGCYEMGSASVACPGDIGRTGGVEGPDGRRDNNDFVVFIDWFFGPDTRADIGTTGGVPGSDGRYDNNDFIVFIDRFFAPC